MKFGKLSISGGVVLAAALMYFLGEGQILWLTVLAASVHELGHYTALRLRGGEVTAVKLELSGAVMYNAGCLTYGGEIVTAAAGPAASALLALVSAFYARFSGSTAAYRLAGLSLIFCVFNLMPVYPLDGGRILKSAVSYFRKPETAEKIVCVTGCAVIFTGLCAGAYVFSVTKTNFTLLAAAVCLLIGYSRSIRTSDYRSR